MKKGIKLTPSADRSPGIYVYIYSEKIYVYIYSLGSFGNLATLGSRMNGKWKLHGERTALVMSKGAPWHARQNMKTHSVARWEILSPNLSKTG